MCSTGIRAASGAVEEVVVQQMVSCISLTETESENDGIYE